MIGVILAAGMAKRLRPLTNERPKCLLPVGGKTLLQRTIDAMVAVGIKEFLVVTGYKGGMVQQALTSYLASRITIHFMHNVDYEHNNNIYSLWMSMQMVRGKEFLLMDSDILCDPEAVMRVARQPKSALALNRHELGAEEMKIVVDSNMNITEISKTCHPKEALGESVGIEKISADYSEALAEELDQMILAENLENEFYERAFERLIPLGYTFRVVDTTDLFSYEIDTPEDYYRAKELFEG